MTDLKAIITDIIDRNAAIHYEWGEDIYIANTEELADRIVDKVYEFFEDELGGVRNRPKSVDPVAMDKVGEKIAAVNSWANDVDRQGGSFTDREIIDRITW